MRIHTDILTSVDLNAAANRAGEFVLVEFTRHGSRSRHHAFNVQLSGTSNRRRNSGNRGAGYDGAATWDEWGMFLAELFRRDPDAVVPNVYENGEHFRWVTCARFDTLEPADQCSPSGHKWSNGVSVATGSYYVNQCQREGCDATQRNARSREALAIILGD